MQRAIISIRSSQSNNMCSNARNHITNLIQTRVPKVKNMNNKAGFFISENAPAVY